MIVNLHVTGDCNLRCDYCYASPKTREHMRWETARSAIELARAEGGDTHVIFFGGEPLLRLDLLQRLVLDSKREGAPCRFQVVTNGVLLDEQRAAWLGAHGVSVSLSLDGGREAHDLHRRAADGLGTWDRVTRSVPILLEHHPYLHVQMVISPDTAHLFDRSVASIFALGVRFVSASLDYRATWDRASLGALERAYRRAAKLYQDKTLRGDRFFLSTFDARIRSRVRPCRDDERCTAGWRQMSVAPSGRIYPCVQFVGDGRDPTHCIGDVAVGFDPDARLRFRRESEAEKQECQGCALQGRCSSWCACVHWSGVASLRRVSPVLCEHERLLMPIADALAARLFRKRNGLFLHKHYNAAYPILSASEDILAQGDP